MLCDQPQLYKLPGRSGLCLAFPELLTCVFLMILNGFSAYLLTVFNCPAFFGSITSGISWV